MKTLHSLTLAAIAMAAAVTPSVAAADEVDRLMQQVFANRDAAWQRLDPFIVRETFTLEVEAPAAIPLSGFEREYEWVVRDGLAVRRLVRLDGVDLEEPWQRANAEDERAAGRRVPEFIAASTYFLFNFEPGRYLVTGRETLDGRELVRIEYYPARLIGEDADARIRRGLSKTTRVTFWVDPVAHQVVRYVLDNPGLDFLRFRWLARVEALEATVEMTPVGGAWMPARIRTAGHVTTARGEFGATFTREFFEYQEAETEARQVGPRVVAEVLVHGNHSMPDADVIRLAEVKPGDTIAPGTLDAVAGRLRDSGRFDQVDVHERYRSLKPDTSVTLVLVVRERPRPVRGGPILRVLHAASRQALVSPIVDHEDGYGVSYGARVTLVDLMGPRSRLSVPLTRGGTRQAAVELERRFDTAWLHAVRGGVSSSQQQNPHHLVRDRRVSAWLGADRRLTDVLRISTGIRRSDVSFGPLDAQVTMTEVGLDFDTRRNAAFPRNAVHVQAAWQRLDPAGPEEAVLMPRFDARGYVGFTGRTVLAVRARYDGASAPVPAYAQPWLGGRESVRGHRAGARAGDRIAAASIELRRPLTSPRRVGRIGARVFFDTGASFGVNERLARTRFSQGAGVGLFASAAFLSVQVDAAHDLRGGLRLHVGTGVGF